MEGLEIIKELGHGKRSVVYLAKYKGKTVIYKITHVLQNDIDEKNSRYYATLKFYEDIANHYPNHFLTLLDHKIDEKCSFEYKYRIDSDNSKEVHQSKICLMTIEYPILDITLKDYYHHINRLNSFETLASKQRKIYSFVAQFNCIFMLMQTKGWQHLDSHVKNIMGVYTDDKYDEVKINDLKFKIPMFGTRWYTIDYDPMFNKSFNGNVVIKSGAWEYLRNDIHYYLINVIEYILYQPYWSVALNARCDWVCADAVVKKILNSPNTSYIKQLLPDIQEPETLKSCAIALAIVLEPEAYMKYRGFNKQLKPEKFDKLLQLTKNGQYFDADDIKFYVKNLGNPEKNIRYFIERLTN